MRILDFADGFESSSQPTSVAFPASQVSVTPTGNLGSSTAQNALVELQGDIDNINGKIGTANGIAPTGSDNKIPYSYLPSIAIVEVYAVADLTARNALTVDEGDIAIVANAGSGVSKTYVYNGSSWLEILADGSLAAHISTTTGIHGVTGNIVGTSDSQSLTNKVIDALLNTISNITNTSIKANAAIALSKLAALTSGNRALVSDGSGFISESSVTATQLGYVSGVTSAIQTQIDGKVDKSTLTTKGDIYVATGSGTLVRLGVGSDGQVLTADSAQSSGLKYATAATAPVQSYELSNLGLACSVSGNALTIALKQSDGSTDPSAGSPVKIGMRSSTAGSGAFNQRSVTSSLSVTVPSGATLGFSSGTSCFIYVYAIDNAGTIELAVSSLLRDTTSLVTTTAISTSSDDSGFYSTTARSNVPARLLGRLKYSTAPNGTYSAVPGDVTLAYLGTDLFVPEFFGQKSSTFSLSSTTSNTTPALTNNSITLQPGRYRIQASAQFNGSGTQSARAFYLGVMDANGDGSTSISTYASSHLITPAVGDNSLVVFSFATNASEQAPTMITNDFVFDVTSTKTIYANAAVTFSSAGGASFNTSIYAEKIKQ